MIDIRTATWDRDHPCLAEVRRTVFIDEQGVPEALEWDDLDASADHFLAIADAVPIGTARLVIDTTAGNEGHIGRVAVLQAWRRQGVATALLREALAMATRRGVHRVTLNAQTYVAALYGRLGFRIIGPEFLDAGLPHVPMARDDLSAR